MQQQFTLTQAILLFVLASIWTISVVGILYGYNIQLPFSEEILIHGGIIGLILLFIAYKQRSNTYYRLSDDLRQICVSGRFIAIALLTALSLWLLDTVNSIWVLQEDIGKQARQLLLRANSVGFVSTSLAVCILAPLMEEMLFRGVFLPAFCYKNNQYIGIFSSAVLFSLIHFSLDQAVVLLMAGLCFGVLRVKSGSIWPSFLAHSANNTLTWIVYIMAWG